MYYRDHFGFRYRFIRWHNYALVKWLDSAPVTGIIFGKEGWLYFNQANLEIIDDLRGNIPVSPTDLAKITFALEKRRDWLAQQNIRFLFVISPEKHSIYPEFLSEKYLFKPGRTRLDQLVQHLNENSDLPFIDFRPSLLAAKKDDRLFYKTDTHWNDRGARIVYKHLNKRLQAFFPESPEIRKEILLEKEDIEYSGDLALFVALRDILIEKEVRLNIQDPSAKKQPLPVKLDGIDAYTMHNEKARLHAVVFGDSMFFPIIPYLSEQFRLVDFLWLSYNEDILKQLISHDRPDIVIVEVGERLLYNVDDFMERRELDQFKEVMTHASR